MSEYTPTTSEVREQFARGARGGYGGSAEAVIAHLNEWLDENRPLRCTIDYGCEGDAQDDYAIIKRILAALDTGKETGE